MLRQCVTSLVAAIVALDDRFSSPPRACPRTPWGDPDLQGIWPSGGLITVPFERPVEFGTRALLTDKEYADRAAAVQRRRKTTRTPISTGTAPSVNPPSHWLESRPRLAPGVAHRRSAGRTTAADDRRWEAARGGMAVHQPDCRIRARAGLQHLRPLRHTRRPRIDASRTSTTAAWRFTRRPG